MARFGDIARIEARGRDVRVTLKSGTVFDLDRFEASDFDDGVRVWDGRRGVVDLDSLRIRAIELLPTPALGAAPHRLHGTVRTRQGDFTGFVAVGPGGVRRLRRARRPRRRGRAQPALRHHPLHRAPLARQLPGDAARRPRDRALRAPATSAAATAGSTSTTRATAGCWSPGTPSSASTSAPGGSGPAYGDFPPGRPLTGSVTTRDGRRLAGRLVYDLDESETTETLDAPSQGVDYTIPFGLIASIVLPGREERGARAPG